MVPLQWGPAISGRDGARPQNPDAHRILTPPCESPLRRTRQDPTGAPRSNLKNARKPAPHIACER